jgi:hypothetical protein
LIAALWRRCDRTGGQAPGGIAVFLEMKLDQRIDHLALCGPDRILARQTFRDRAAAAVASGV